MIGYVGLTDSDWATFLARRPGTTEVNFWKPGGAQRFAALLPGAPFLFKLHSPRNVIAGGGFFVHFTRLPVSRRKIQIPTKAIWRPDAEALSWHAETIFKR